MNDIGKKLRKARGNIPSKKVAESIGISDAAIRMYETGHRIPRDEVKIKLADFYGMTVQELFFDAKCNDNVAK